MSAPNGDRTLLSPAKRQKAGDRVNTGKTAVKRGDAQHVRRQGGR